MFLHTMLSRDSGANDEAILCSEKCLELDGDFRLSHCRHRTLATGFDLIVGEEDLAGLVSWFMETLEQTGQQTTLLFPTLTHLFSTFPPLALPERAVEYTLCVSSRQASACVGILNACHGLPSSD
jgi:hypothetical protein